MQEVSQDLNHTHISAYQPKIKHQHPVFNLSAILYVKWRFAQTDFSHFILFSDSFTIYHFKIIYVLTFTAWFQAPKYRKKLPYKNECSEKHYNYCHNRLCSFLSNMWLTKCLYIFCRTWNSTQYLEELVRVLMVLCWRQNILRYGNCWLLSYCLTFLFYYFGKYMYL